MFIALRFTVSVLFVFSLIATCSGQYQLGYDHKYRFEFCRSYPQTIAPGEISVPWTLNKVTPLDRTGRPTTVHGKRFIVSGMDLFEDVLWSDTVEQPIAHMTIAQNEHLILQIEEMGTNERMQMLLYASAPALPRADSRIDSLNFALFNGHFLHAASLLHKMKRDELIGEVMEQYYLLFGPITPPKKPMFNTYFDVESNTLQQMPYITEHGRFLQQLRRGLKASRFKGNLIIEATLGPDNEVQQLVTTPEVNREVVQKALTQLQLDSHGLERAKLILVVDRGILQWRIVNRMALTDPSSKSFKSQHRGLPTGAVHR